MEQIIFQTSFSKIGFQNQLRLDPKYRFFKDKKNNRTEILEKSNTEGIPLRQILTIANTSTVKKGELNEEMILIDLDDIEPGFGVLKQKRIVTEIDSDKTVFGDSDIICSKLTPEKGHFFINDKTKRYIGTTELIGYKLKNNNWNLKFLLYLLLHKKFRQDLEFLTSGKTHPRIQFSDFLAMRIPFVEYSKQQEIVEKIKEIETKILQIKLKIESLQDIIDDVFEKYFVVSLREQMSSNYFRINLSNLVNNNTQIRFSYHYSNPKYKNIFRKIPSDLKVPFYKVFKIKSGKRIPKGQSFSKEETNYRYLRPNEVKNFYVDYESMPYISEKLYSILYKYQINDGDFAISIVGTLGKIVLLKKPEEISHQKVILSENFAKLEHYNKEVSKDYLFYFLNSQFLKVQIDKEYTITTQMKLGLDKLKKLFIILPKKKKIEEKIVSEIQQREEKNNQYKEQIKKLREEIDDLIYQSLG